jgi:hypothetical protein
MKTAKFFPVLIATMIFAGITTLYAKESPDSSPSRFSKPVIRYEVTVHMPSGFSICQYSLYLVRITDEKGRLVTPPQVFIPGQSKYVFTESVSVPSNTRVASIYIPPYVDPYGCPVTMTAEPDVKQGPFSPGRSYSFDLYPKVTGGDEKSVVH